MVLSITILKLCLSLLIAITPTECKINNTRISKDNVLILILFTLHIVYLGQRGRCNSWAVLLSNAGSKAKSNLLLALPFGGLGFCTYTLYTGNKEQW